jgi:hypothetical protein
LLLFIDHCLTGGGHFRITMTGDKNIMEFEKKGLGLETLMVSTWGGPPYQKVHDITLL